MTTFEHLCDALNDVHAVASLVSFVADQASFRDFGNEMSKEDFRGLAVIMTWMRDRIDRSRRDVGQRLEASDLDMMRRLGIPEEAFADERLRQAWRDGFSHGLSRAEKETPK